MKTLHFSTLINAPRRHVWDTMLGERGFREWTAEFAEGSHYEGGWERGRTIRFLAPDGNGMVGVIAENRPFEFVSIRYTGLIEGGVDDTESEAVRRWVPAYESYTFSARGPSTGLEVDVDVPPDFEAFMLDAWPRALARLKALCEEAAVGGAMASGWRAPVAKGQ